MKQSVRTGISFGLVSGIITTLGLIVGLNSGTHLKMVVVGGILVIAVADAFSDALGIHVSEESNKQRSGKEIWESTLSTFFSKFVIALTFLFPVLLFKLSLAIIISVIWGLLLIGFFSFYLAKQQKKKALPIVLEHIFIAILVIIITHYVGDLVSTFI
ncbi:hypothetical protein KKG58_05900 [Patescibacteria group bacterium]|nr:hypothetical protein [Patescibacteria group bacterium]